MNLLLVEDDSGIASVMEKVLQRVPLEVVRVPTWTEMRALLASRRFDILLLDLGLPDSSTTTTLASIRTLKMEHPEMAICVITGHPSQTKEASMAAGADDFIHKSRLFSPSVLIQTISSLLGLTGDSHRKLENQLYLAHEATKSVIQEMSDDHPKPDAHS